MNCWSMGQINGWKDQKVRDRLKNDRTGEREGIKKI